MTAPPFSAAKRKRVQENLDRLKAQNTPEEEILEYLELEEQVEDTDATVHDRNAAEQVSISETAGVYKNKLASAKPEEKAVLENRIKNIEKGAQVGTSLRQAATSLGIGALQGAVAPLDLVAGAVNLPLKGIDAVAGTGLSKPLSAARGMLAERVMEGNEALGQSRTGVAEGAQFLGNIVGGAAGYSGLASAAAKPLLSMATRIPALAGTRIMRLLAATNATAETGASVSARAAVAGQRALGTAVVGAPLNALQAATMDGATAGERAKTFAIGVGADLLGGGMRGAFGKSAKLAAPVDPGPVDPTAAARVKVNQRMLAEAERTISVEGKARLAGTKADAELAWNLENPHTPFSSLEKSEQRALVHKHKQGVVLDTRRKVQELYAGKIPDATVESVMRWPGVGAIMHNLGDAITRKDMPALAKATTQLDAALMGVPDDVVKRVMANVDEQIDVLSKGAQQLKPDVTALPKTETVFGSKPSVVAKVPFGAKPAPEMKALPRTEGEFRAPESSLYTADAERNAGVTSQQSVLRHGGDDVTVMKVRDRRLRDVEETTATPTPAQIQARLDRAAGLAPKTKRTGIVLETAPEIGGSLLGFVASSATIQDSDSEEVRNMKRLFGIVAGGAAGYGARTWRADPTPRVRTVSEQEVMKTIKMRSEFLEMQRDTKMPLAHRLLSKFASTYHAYIGYIRPSEMLSSVHTMAAGKGMVSDASNVMFEGALAMKPVMQAFSFLDGGGPPVLPKPDGTLHTFEGVKNMTAIILEGKGDYSMIDALSKSNSILERHARGRVTLTPEQVQHYRNVQSSAAPEVQAAAASLRALNLSLVEALKMHGVISDASYAKMQADPFYTPLNILFQDKVTSGTVFGKTQTPTVGGDNPIKRLKGSTGDEIHQSPLERTMELIPRVMAAIHVAEVQNKFLGAVTSMGEAGKWLAVPEGKVTQDPLLQRVVDDYTKNGVMDVDEVKKMYALAQGGTLDASSPVMLRFNQGTLERYRINPVVAHAMRGLSPFETFLGTELTGMGIISNPLTRGAADMARFGIAVTDPMFRFISALKNEMQTAIHSDIPYVPGEGAHGMWMAAKNDPMFKEGMAYGAVGGRHTMAYEKTPADVMRHVKRFGGSATVLPGESKFTPRAIGDLYNSKMEPLSDATAMQLYYRARGLGWAPQKAAFYTVEAQGNVQQLGYDAKVLARVGLFWRAITGGTDRFVYSTGLHPFRTYGDKSRIKRALPMLAKGFGMISVPAVTYWAYTKDDKELTEARRSAWGRQRIVMRKGGEIVGIPLSELEAPFWSLPLNALDKMFDGKESQAGEIAKQWLANTVPDVVPQGYQTLLSAVTGTDLRTRKKIIPLEAQGNSPAMQYTDKTTTFAKQLGQAAGMSPAMIDYLLRQVGGTSAVETIEAYDVAERWLQEDWAPVSSELPFLRRFVRGIPDTRTEYVERFYRQYADVDEVMRDMTDLVRDGLITKEWIEENKVNISRGKFYYTAKKAMTDIRKALHLIEVSKDLPRRVKEEQRVALTEQLLVITRSVADMDEKIVTANEAR